MGHCISIYVIKKSELREDKINKVLSDKNTNQEIVWTELKEVILATTYIPNIRDFGKDKTVGVLSTDYFGGSGHQEGKIFVNNKKEYEGSSEFNWSERPINTILMKMGISKKEGLDEFDTVGLSNFRSNSDFN
jgi:hypothetical protein